MSKKKTAPKKLQKQETSKQQKLQEKEVVRQRELVKNVIWPFLIANTKSPLEAKKLCYEVSQIMNQSFQLKVSEYQKTLSDGPTSELPFTDIINKGDGFKVDKALVALLATEKLSVTNALIGGMVNAIDSFINEEMSKRNLESLKTTFL